MLKKCKETDCNNWIDGEKMRLFCSQACRQKAYRKRTKFSGRKVVTTRALICRNCATPFCSSQPKAAFCKTSCRVSFHQQMKRLGAIE